MQDHQQLNVLMKFGSEPILSAVPSRMRAIDSRIRTFGILNSDSQDHTYDHVITTSIDSMLAAHTEYLSENLYVRPEIYAAVSHVEGRVLRIYDRVVLEDQTKLKHPSHPTPRFRGTTDDRSQLFLRQVAYWDWVLLRHKINAVIWQNYAHVGWDCALEAVARANRIPYLFFHEVRPFLNSQYIFDSVEAIGDLSLGEHLITAAKAHGWYVEDTAGRGDAMCRQISILSENSPSQSLGLPDGFFMFRRRIGRLLTSPKQFHRSLRRRWSNYRSMKDERNSLSCGNLPVKYLFCELQSQPNATTAIKGWMFPDQRESLAMIASELPDDWRLVVKESDRQWSRMMPRRKNYWSQIAALERVYVVSSNADSRSLMRGSCGLLETSYSTLALEAVLNRVPVLILGKTHIAGLPGVLQINSTSEARDAVSRIILGKTEKLDEKQLGDEIQKFVGAHRAATLEGALSSTPHFESDDELRRYQSRLESNVAGIAVAWLHKVSLSL